MTIVLQLKSAWVCPAEADMQSRSIAVGLDMVLNTPTMAWKCLSVLLSHPSRPSMWIGVILPGSRWTWIADLG